MEIIEMRDSDRPAWDEYVQNSVHGLPYQLSGWRDILASEYGYQTHYLLARESNRIVGVFPLLVIHSLLVGSRATSVQGGLCAENEQTAARLIEQGREIAIRAGVKQLVIQDSRIAWPGNILTTSGHVHWVIDITANRDTLWQTLPRNIHREVKKAQKNSLEALVDDKGERLDDLYDVLSRFAHQAGSPYFRRNFLESVTRAFPGGFHSVLVYRDKQPLGGYFLLDMKKKSHGVWGSTLPEYLSLGAAYLAYWAILSDAAERDFHCLDLGRSPVNSNASAFKGRWGGISEPVYQQAINLKGRLNNQVISEKITSDGKMQFFMKVWPHIPYPLAQYIGPKLRRHVPFA